MIYSTCTFNPMENEEVVAFALKTFPLELEGPPEHLGVGQGGRTGHGLTPEECAMVLRFDPHDARCDSIGFFAAKLVKTKSMLSR